MESSLLQALTLLNLSVKPEELLVSEADQGLRRAAAQQRPSRNVCRQGSWISLDFYSPQPGTGEKFVTWNQLWELLKRPCLFHIDKTGCTCEWREVTICWFHPSERHLKQQLWVSILVQQVKVQSPPPYFWGSEHPSSDLCLPVLSSTSLSPCSDLTLHAGLSLLQVSWRSWPCHPPEHPGLILHCA